MLIQGKKGEVYYNARAYETDTFDKNSELYPEFMCLFTIKKEFTANDILVYPVISKMKQTEYEKYGVLPSKEYPSEIKSVGEEGNIEIEKINKNLIKLEFTNDKTNVAGLDFRHNISTFSMKGKPTSTWTSFNLKERIYIEKDKNYTFSFKVKGECPNVQLTIKFSKSGKIISNWNVNTNSKNNTNTIKSIIEYKEFDMCSFVIESLKTDLNYDFTIEVQLEENTKATEYEEHEEERFILPVQQPLRRIGNIADTFIKKEGKWYERHKIERIEEYKDETITTEYISTTGELSQGATVDYILEEAKDLECTKEQEEALEKIKETRTYKNETIIYSTEEVKPIIEIKYRKDIETILENITEAIIATGGV